jgi:Fic family protein
MARFEERLWEGAGPGSGLSRKDRRGGAYEVYIPDSLIGGEFWLGGRESADVSDAEREITLLESHSSALVDTEALARLLLRAESVASSRIEGLVVGPARILRADAARESGEPERDETAAEVLGNIEAMSHALHSVNEGQDITLPLLLEAHRRLLTPTALAPYAGQLRTVQNWIGGSSYNPCSAIFVPPPPELVEELMLDLCRFCNDDSLPTVAQAAIAHAQFETIHPFVDGNGRIGRALIHLVFRRRGLTHRTSPPVSLVLATRAQDYMNGLNATSYAGERNSPEATAAINQWVGTFAAACSRAATEAMAFEERIRAIQDGWRARLGSMRSDAAALRLIEILPGAPVITLASAERMISRSLRATIDGMEALQNVGIVRPSKVGRRRKQVFEAHEIIDAFTALERQLASPAGDTLLELPSRAVPSRRPSTGSG